MTEKKVMLINVLPKDMYDDCHIKGSVNVPLDNLESFAKSLDKDQPIVLYCSSYSCTASAKGWRMLNALGFKNLWAYEGGMNEWFHADFPSVGNCTAPYLSNQIEKPEEEPKDIKQIYTEELRFLVEKHGLLEQKK